MSRSEASGSPPEPTRGSWQRGALNALRRAESELGVAQHHFRNAGMPASMRATERLKERAIKVRHKIEDETAARIARDRR